MDQSTLVALSGAGATSEYWALDSCKGTRASQTAFDALPVASGRSRFESVNEGKLIDHCMHAGGGDDQHAHRENLLISIRFCSQLNRLP